MTTLTNFLMFSCVLTISVLFTPRTYAQSNFNDLTRATIHPLYLEKAVPTRAYGTLRDGNGYLWIASENSNNLLRYDGYTIKEFPILKGEASSADRRLRVLHPADDGSIWIGSTSLVHFHPDTETFEAYDVYDPGYLIDDIETDVNGTLWIGGQGANLVGFDPKSKTVTHNIAISDSHYPLAHTITSIARSLSKTKLWLATGSGVYLFDTQTLALETYPIPKSVQFGHRLLRDIIVDDEDFAWVATSQGLLRINPETKQYQQFVHNHSNLKGLSTNDLWSVFQDSHGNIWVGTDKKGVHVTQNKGQDFLHIPSSAHDASRFPFSSIVDIFEDCYGSLWFSAGYYGVRRISTHLDKFYTIKHHVDDPNSLSFNYTRAIVQDRHDNLWIATDGGGLDYYQPKTNQFTHFTHNPDDPNSLSSDSVISLALDKSDTLWIGTWGGGLNKFNPDTKTFTRIQKQTDLAGEEGLMNNNIFMTHVDDFGRVWLNALGVGLQIYDPKNKSFLTFPATKQNSTLSTVNTSIFEVLANHHDTYWLGGNFGLELFNFKAKTFKRVLPDKIQGIYDILAEPNDQLWLATSSGLIRYDIPNNKTTLYTVEDGLIHNNVTSISKDKRGLFWLGTRGGLSRFDPVKHVFTNYDNDDGLPGTQFNQYAHVVDKSGVIYLGSVNGIAVFDPINLPKNSNSPKIALTGVEVFDKNGKPLSQYQGQIKAQERKGILLPYSDRNIAFEFSALSFIQPAKNFYKYKLEGFDNEWIVADSRHRNARYTNLHPGRYQLRIVGSNNDGVWNLNGVSMKIQVLPPWWLTWWAISLLVLCTLLLFFLFINWRIRQNRIRNRTLELLVEEKTINLDLNRKLNERTTNILERERKIIAHEVHDNINSTIVATRLITQSIERLACDRAPNTQRIQYLAKKADQQLAETYDFFRNLVQKIRPEIIETMGCEEAIAELVEKYKRIHLRCNFEFHRQGTTIPVNEEVAIGLFRITQEAITNAVKHAEPTEIVVELQYDDSEINFSIKDNGKGLPDNVSLGIGITHMKERALSMHGVLTVHRLDDPGESGTIVVVRVPASGVARSAT